MGRRRRENSGERRSLEGRVFVGQDLLAQSLIRDLPQNAGNAFTSRSAPQIKTPPAFFICGRPTTSGTPSTDHNSEGLLKKLGSFRPGGLRPSSWPSSN